MQNKDSFTGEGELSKSPTIGCSQNAILALILQYLKLLVNLMPGAHISAHVFLCGPNMHTVLYPNIIGCMTHYDIQYELVVVYVLTFSFCYVLQDVDRLEHESRKVFQALRYMEDAVNKRILQLLPGAATIVLETIMEVNQLLSNYFTNQDRSVESNWVS